MVTVSQYSTRVNNGDAVHHSHSLFMLNGKIYYGTNAGGYSYLVEYDPATSTKRELQLFQNDGDATFGQDDYHGVPVFELITTNTLLVVGGGHGSVGPTKWAVVDLTSFTKTNAGQFGEPITYYALFKNNDGTVTLLTTLEDSSWSNRRRLVKYEFDPNTNSWTGPVFLTQQTIEVKEIARIYGSDGISLSIGTYFDIGFILYDRASKNIKKLDGTVLTIPFDQRLLEATTGQYRHTTRILEMLILVLV